MCSVTWTEPAPATRPTSLRPRSISIRCSARSFGSASSSLSSAASSSAVAPRRRVPGDRPHLDAAAVEPHQHLGRRAGDARLGELEVEHVRRRVDHAQRAVDVERIDVAARRPGTAASSTTWNASPARMYSWMRRTPAHTPRFVTVEAARRRRAGQRRVQRPQRRRRPRQAVDHRLDARAGVVVGATRVAPPARHVDRRDDLERAAQVVEDHHRVGDDEAELGQAEVVGLRARQPLEARTMS